MKSSLLFTSLSSLLSPERLLPQRQGAIVANGSNCANGTSAANRTESPSSLLKGVKNCVGQEVVLAGHRGFSDKYPENTMAAFKAAKEIGLKVVELDIHLCQDEVVVLHDETLRGTYKGLMPNATITAEEAEAYLDVPIEKISYDIVKQFNVGTLIDHQKVPLLKEVLEWSSDHQMRTLTEIKNLKNLTQDMDKISRVFADVVSCHPLRGLAEIISLDQNILRAKKHNSLMDDYPHSLVLNSQCCTDEAIAIAQALNCKAIDIEASLTAGSFMRKIQESGLEIYAWKYQPAVIEAKVMFTLGLDIKKVLGSNNTRLNAEDSRALHRTVQRRIEQLEEVISTLVDTSALQDGQANENMRASNTVEVDRVTKNFSVSSEACLSVVVDASLAEETPDMDGENVAREMARQGKLSLFTTNLPRSFFHE